MKAKTKVVVTLGVHKDKKGVVVGKVTKAMTDGCVRQVKIEGETYTLSTHILKEDTHE